MQNLIKKYSNLIVASILLIMAFISIYNADRDTLIYDEDAHIPAGYSYLKEQDMRLNPEHPPLLKNLSAFPLLFLDLNFDTKQKFWNSSDANFAQWEAGKHFLFSAGNDPDQIIFWSRIPIILLSLILGLFLFFWAKEIAGVYAGLIALALYAFDPNILGHNHFVTTDLGIAAFITFAFYYFLKFIKNPTWKNTFLSGLFLALMQLTKFSSVITFPVLILVLIIYPLAEKGETGEILTIKLKLKKLYNYLFKGFTIFAFSFLIIWIFYFLNTYKMPAEKLVEITNHYFFPNDPRPQIINARKLIFAVNDIPVLQPLAVYLFGIIRVFQRVGGGNVTFFMGQISSAGFFSYFPFVFIIKEPLSTLALILFSFSLGIFVFLKNSTKNFFKSIPNRLRNFFSLNISTFALLLFIFLYSLSSITGRLNIGYRHLFPIFPLIYLLVATSIVNFTKTIKNHSHKKLFSWLIASLLFLTALETASSFPYYTSYFNQLAGGPKNGYRYVTDSNADWGQDLKRLRIWIKEYNTCNSNCNQKSSDLCTDYNSEKCEKLVSILDKTNNQPIEDIYIDYFGMADLHYYIGDHYSPWWGSKHPTETGWYAISALFLQESIYDTKKPDNETYRWTKKIQPIAQVGTSIFVYYLGENDLKKINQP